MNTNVMNQSKPAFDVFLTKVKKSDLYTSLLTRARIGQLYDKYQPEAKSLPLNDDQLIRGLITICLRYSTMKVYDLSVFLVLGLNSIQRLDLDIPVRDLAGKLANQNQDGTDLDTANRMLGQITSKLPGDMRDKFTPQQRLGVVSLIYQQLGFKLKRNPNEPANNKYERFAGTLVDASKYMTEEEKKSALEDNYLEELEQILGRTTLEELKKQGYDPKDFSTKNVVMNINKGNYEQQLLDLETRQGSSPGKVNTIPSTTAAPTKPGDPEPSRTLPLAPWITNKNGEQVIHAGYVDNNPEIQMDIKKGDIYFYDKQSCSLVPVNDVDVIEGEKIFSRRQLEKLLREYSLSPGEIDNLYANLKDSETIAMMRPGSNGPASPYEDPDLPLMTEPPKEEGLSSGAIAGIVIGVLLAVILIGLAIWWFGFRGRNNRAANNPAINTHF